MRRSTLDIAEEVRMEIGDPDKVAVSNTLLLKWINAGLEDFVMKTRVLKYVWDFSTVAYQQEYAFPPDLKIIEIRGVTVDGEPIWPTYVEELDLYSRTWRYEAGGPTGKPLFWYISSTHDSEFGLFKCPDDVYSVRCYIDEGPPKLTAIAADVFPKIEDIWHEAIVYFCEWKGHLKRKNRQAAQEAKLEYYDKVNDAKRRSVDRSRVSVMLGPEYYYREKPKLVRFPDNYGVIE